MSPDGKRQDTAYRYLHPLLQSGEYPDLHVVVEAKVKRVVFEGKKAVGVEFQGKGNEEMRTVKARKMVIVACGALGTPAVLERSGVGTREVLEKAGVEMVADIPGVGENYQDHHLMVYPYLCSLNERETLDALVGGRMDASELIKRKDPILGWNAMDATVKLRPTDEEVEALGPEFQKLWNKDYKDSPNRPLTCGSMVNA